MKTGTYTVLGAFGSGWLQAPSSVVSAGVSTASGGNMPKANQYAAKQTTPSPTTTAIIPQTGMRNRIFLSSRRHHTTDRIGVLYA